MTGYSGFLLGNPAVVQAAFPSPAFHNLCPSQPLHPQELLSPTPAMSETKHGGKDLEGLVHFLSSTCSHVHSSQSSRSWAQERVILSERV